MRAVARELGRRAQVRFRMRPRYLELQAPLRLLRELASTPPRRSTSPASRPRSSIAAGREAVAAPELDVLGLMSHLGRHRNDLADLARVRRQRRRDGRGARGRVGRLAAARARPRRRLLRPARPQHLGLRRRRRTAGRARDRGRRRGARERPARGPRRTRAAGRRGARDRARPRRCTPTRASTSRASSTSSGRREPLAWSWVETDTTEMFLLDLLVEHCRFPVVAADAHGRAGRRAGRRGRLLVRLRRARAPGAAAAGRDRRHARVPRHGRLRGRVRGQLQRAAATGDRPRERLGAPRSCAAPRRSRTSSRAT